MKFNPLLMLLCYMGNPAQFLRINKITQDFVTAFLLVLLEMKNWYYSFQFLEKCSELVRKKNTFSFLLLFLYFILSVAQVFVFVRVCQLILMGLAERTKAAHFTPLSTIIGCYKPHRSRCQCQGPDCTRHPYLPFPLLIASAGALGAN